MSNRQPGGACTSIIAPAPTRLLRPRLGPDGPDEDVLNDLATPQELYLAEQEPGRSTLPGGRSGHGWR